MSAADKITTYYVTAIALPRGASSLPTNRTDMGRFYDRAHAEAFMDELSPAGFFEKRIEERTEADDR